MYMCSSPKQAMSNVISTTSLLFSFMVLLLFSSSNADVLGFSADLIHIDSPASPFYDPSKTRFDRLHDVVRQSHIRANHFASASKNVHSTSIELVPSSGFYIMKISLGTPPITIFAIADTGSDITWMQCTPCIQCFKQKQPLFNPKKSSTYKIYPYESNTCQSLDVKYRSPNNTCEYEVVYGSTFVTRGVLAAETITLGDKSSRPVYFPEFTFGCGFNNSGNFPQNAIGLVGLGGGPNSLISQIKPFINGKFSYCLTPSFSETVMTSQINFGNNAEVSGIGIAYTPIIPNGKDPYYYLNLEALYVDKHKVDLFNSSSDSIVNAGNIIIDSGSPVSYLLPPIYDKFVNLVRKVMGSKTVHDPNNYYDLCYRISDKPSYPKIQAQFTGASIDLKPINTFIQIGHDVTCLAFSFGFWPQVYGSIAQTNFLIGYDTVKGIVSFKPAKCGHMSY